VLYEMLAKSRQLFQVKFQFLIGHCFDYPFSIVWEKEKWTTAASPLTCFEHHITVELGTQWLVKVCQLGHEIFVENLLEDVKSMVSNCDCLIQSEHILIYITLTTIECGIALVG
jgi:hypothetical protein